MIIFTAIKYDIDRFLKWGVLLCFVFGSMAIGWIICLFLWHPASWTEMDTRLREKKMSASPYFYPLDAMGSGPLALYPRIACGWVSRIAQEFSVIAFNSRPDVLQKEAKILVAVRDGVEQSINNGRMIFLQERVEGKGLALSELPTSLWVKPLLLDNGNVLVEAGRKLISKEGNLIGEEKGEFIAFPVKNAAFKHQESKIPCLAELREARYLGKDPLILKYGGEEYSSWKNKIGMEFTSGSRTYACFVSEGDLLQYKDKEWHSVSPNALEERFPLARVLSITSKEIEIQAWDESGFFSIPVKIADQRMPLAAVPQDLLPRSLRMRSNTQVSCLLGKKRLIIKKADWLLRTSSGWRSLRRVDEIEDYLYHRLKGELFIFDGIEKQEGKCVLQGYFFDPLRTDATLITIPIDAEKKGPQKKYKKNKQLSLEKMRIPLQLKKGV